MCLSSFTCFKAPRRLETKSKSTSLQKTAKEITKVVRSISTSTQLASSKCKSLLLRKKVGDKRESLDTEELSTLPSSSSLAEADVTILESVENVQIIDALDIALQTPLPESRSISSFTSEVIIEEFKTKESEVVSLVVTFPTSQSEVNLSETFLLPLTTPLPEEDNHSLDEIFDVAFELTDDFKKGASALLTIEQDIETILDPCNVPLPLSPSPSGDQLIIPVEQSGDNEETVDPSIAFGLESANLSGSMIMCDEGQVVEIPDTLTTINDEKEMPEESTRELPMDSSSNDEEIESKVQQSYSTNVKLEISQLPSQVSPSSSGSLIDMAFSHESNQLSTSFSEGSTVLSLDTLFSGTVPSKGLISHESQSIVSLVDIYASVPEQGTGMIYDEEQESTRLSEVDSEAESVLALALLTPLPLSFSSVISLPNLFEPAPLEDLGSLDSFASLHLDNLFDDEAFCSVSELCNNNGLDVATTFLMGLPTPPTSPLLGDGEAQGATAEVSYFHPQCTETVPFSDAVQASDYVLPTPPPSPELPSALVINLANPPPPFSPPSFPTVDLHTTTPAQPVEEEESIEEEEEERIIDEDIIKLREHVSDVLRTWGENAIESRNLGLRKIQLRNWLESSVDAVEACLTLIGEQKFDWSKKVETAPKKVGDLATKQCNRHKNIIKACTTDNFGPKGPVHPFAALSGPSPNAPPPPPPFNGQGQFIPISEGGPETGPTAKAGEQRSAKSMYMIGLASSGKNGSNTGAQVCGDVASAIREAMKNGKPKLRSTLAGRSLWSKPAGEEIHEAAQVKLRSCRDSLGV
ncbi:hypothetical protein C8Q75DRAFT_177959 [Abortiporus biennis]|nr:hypothetical protein C8Q75DRAFT_177959 [Abortiporus biennis]